MAKNDHSVDEKKELRRNWVRVLVTYGAAAYLFVFGPAMVVALFKATDAKADNVIAAKDMFMALLPIASGIVAYWFAARKPEQKGGEDEGTKPEDSESG